MADCGCWFLGIAVIKSFAGGWGGLYELFVGVVDRGDFELVFGGVRGNISNRGQVVRNVILL